MVKTRNAKMATLHRIKDINHLMVLTLLRRAVIYGPHMRRVPASFMQNWQCRIVAELIRRGQLWEYRKGTEK